MSTPPPSVRAYKILGSLALAHAIAVLALTSVVLGGLTSEHEWFLRLWVGSVTLWFLWPVVLALHRGRSIVRFIAFISIATVLLLPSLRFYSIHAPWTFGFPDGVTLSPLSAWQYFSAYRAGRAEAQKDVAAGVLAIEEFGLPDPGLAHYVRIMREQNQIEVRRVAGCLVDEKILGHAAGYNEISEPEIDRRVGRFRVDAAREEAARLDKEERERQEQYGRDLAKRLSSLLSDSKITLLSAQPWINDRRQLDSETEEELRRSIRELEKFVSEAVPEDAPAFELHISADLTSTERPQFETSASASVPRPVYDSIYQNLPNLPLPPWRRDRLALSLDFQVRDPR